MSVSAQAPLAPGPPDTGPPEPAGRLKRPLVVTGTIAACAAAASGLAVLITLTAIGWITAPHVGIGNGLGGVLRTSALLWLVAHHVGFTVRGAGRIGLLPLGLVLLPGALLACRDASMRRKALAKKSSSRSFRPNAAWAASNWASSC